ncbi:MAG: ATP-binding protein [Candidatus Hydrogenedentes bacterium]|nr:ATP-binding protein [Candidatus Hydrogenedentota bacterium]
MIRRHLEPALAASAKKYPIVTVTGPRQSGKTTIVRKVFRNYRYVSLENPDERNFALEDPRGFLKQFSGGVILDEAQRAPDLFSYLQGIVDEDKRAGRFVLTGSQNFLLLDRVSQSLAGRTSVFHLLPFSRSELAGHKLADLARVGRTIPNRRASKEDLFAALYAGFYPRIHDTGVAPQEWLRNYYQTYVERDVRQIVNVGDIEAFGRFTRLCAGRCGQLLNLASLGADCGVSHATAGRWLSALEASFIVYLLRPHHGNFGKRLIKSPKLYFLDTGLLCYLLRIRSADELRTHSARGAVFEAFVLSEVLKSYLHRGAEPDVYFWRDSSGHEVDFLLDHGNSLVPIEAKSGETVAGDFFKGIEYWRSLAGQNETAAALVYGGSASAMRKGVAVYSWNAWL